MSDDRINEIRNTFGKMGSQFSALLPTHEHIDRFVRVIMTSIQDKPDLLECNRNSLYSAALKCAKDGLLPDGKEAHLNVRNIKVSKQGEADRWEKRAEYEPMVEGMLKLFRNSGQCKGTPNVQAVRENDVFDYELGDVPRITHKPAKMNRGTVVGAYSIVRLKDGEVSREYMGIDEILEVRDCSKAKDKGPWAIHDGKHSTQFGEQCRKTVFRRHAKRLPKSTDLDNALKSDNEQYDLERGPVMSESTEIVVPAPAESQRTPGGRKRPKALAAVAEAGGTPSPIQTPKAKQREPVTIDSQAQREPEQQQAKPPADVI